MDLFYRLTFANLYFVDRADQCFLINWWEADTFITMCTYKPTITEVEIRHATMLEF
jgi:hypothetical protein